MVESKNWEHVLVSQYFSLLASLAWGLVNDTLLAEKVVLKVMTRAWAEKSRFEKKSGWENWLIELLVKESRHLEKIRRTTLPVGISWKRPPLQKTHPITKVLRTLGEKESLLAMLTYLLGWQEHQAAKVLKVSHSAISLQAKINRKALLDAISIDPNTLPSDEQKDELIRLAFQDGWPQPSLSAEDISTISRFIRQRAEEIENQRRRQLPLKFLVGSGILLLGFTCLLIIAGIIFLNPLELARKVRPAINPDATPVTPIRQVYALTSRSSSESIQQHLFESSQHWHTLWMDAQVIEYGPTSYIGPARLYRAQSWIAQPDQSLELIGAPNGRPSLAWLASGGSARLVDLRTRDTSLEEWEGQPGSLSHDSLLKKMLFPGTSPWVETETWFEVRSVEKIAGRSTVKVDWFSAEEQRMATLWIDRSTGLVLRLREYSSSEPERVVVEAQVVKIALDIDFPQADLFGAGILTQLGFTETYMDDPRSSSHASEAIFSSPERLRLDRTPPPAGFDPSSGQLTFQAPADMPPSGGNGTLELFAHGFFLGLVEMPNPWETACQRSPDGERLAFLFVDTSSSSVSTELRWFHLLDPARVYRPLPDLSVTNFAFSPSSVSIAAFGSARPGAISGLYLVNLVSAEKELLLEMLHARSLQWSPDGEYLALIGLQPSQTDETVMVIHFRTRQVVYEQKYVPRFPSADWPMFAWGVDFPVEIPGLEICAKAP